MKYLLVQQNNCYFRRKIPKTSKLYTFSLKSKNVRIASKVISLFLIRAEPLFQALKQESKEEIMSSFETILDLLNEYRELALEEYSTFEEERHKQFSCSSKKGIKRDGGHPKCIKKWLKILEDSVFSTDPTHDYREYFDDVYNRTKIDRALLKSLTPKELEKIKIETIKSEAFVLKEDRNRTKERFYGKDINKAYNQVAYLENSKDTKFYEKTSRELADEYIAKKANDTTELHKYSSPIEIFLTVTNEKYLVDVSAEKISEFINVIRHLLPQTKAENKKIHEKYKNDYSVLVSLVKEKNLKKITLKTALEKITNVMAFLDYTVDMERLDKNRLKSSPSLPSRKEKEKINDIEEENRTPFTLIELNNLFKSSWYSKNLQANLKKGQDKIYIPLIALMGGMRLTEIAQLYVNDIKEENGIFYFRVNKLNPNQKLKNTSAKRNVPIHPKLIELGFLKYVDQLKKDGIERIFYQLGENQRGYGTPFGKKFSNKSFKSEWLNMQELKANNETKVFHNFRHNFITKVKQTSKPHRVDALVGHKLQNYKYEHPEIRDLFDVINELNYDDIDFSHIQRDVDMLYS